MIKPMGKKTLLVTALLLAGNVFAFPTSRPFSETIDSFSYSLVAPDGVTGSGCSTVGNETRNYDQPGTFWTVSVNITEDQCADDELFISISAKHILTPAGTTFSYRFDLDDNIDYPDGTKVLGGEITRYLHPIEDYPRSYDDFFAKLTYNVGGSFTDDFTSYTLSLAGVHTNVSEPSVLALLLVSLFAAFWSNAAVALRSGPPRSST